MSTAPSFRGSLELTKAIAMASAIARAGFWKRAREISLGMRQVGNRLAEEVRAIAMEDSSVLAEEVGKWLGCLGDSLVGAHRHRLMAGTGSRLATMVARSCEHLTPELRRERELAVEAVHRSRYGVHQN